MCLLINHGSRWGSGRLVPESGRPSPARGPESVHDGLQLLRLQSGEDRGGRGAAHRRPSQMQVRRGCRALCAGDGGETEVGIRPPHAGPCGDAPARGSGALLSWVLLRLWDACWLQCCSSPCTSSCMRQLRVPRINTVSPVPPCGRWGSTQRVGPRWGRWAQKVRRVLRTGKAAQEAGAVVCLARVLWLSTQPILPPKHAGLIPDHEGGGHPVTFPVPGSVTQLQQERQPTLPETCRYLLVQPHGGFTRQVLVCPPLSGQETGAAQGAASPRRFLLPRGQSEGRSV